MRQHTPGPWRAEKHVTGNYQILAPNHHVDDGLSELVAFDIDSEANARLIAKAPEQEAIITELVRALEAMLRGADLVAAETLDDGKPFPTLMLASAKAQAAIAEAKVTP